MVRKSLFARLALAAVLAAGFGSTATAGIIPVSVSVIPEAGNFRWTYSIVLPSDMKIQSGDYFTIYDFAGLIPDSATVTSAEPDPTYSSNWSFSTSKLGPTPDFLNPNDNADIDNLTWVYNGPTIDVPGKITLGNFSAASSLGLETGTESDMTGRNPRSADGVYDSNITKTTVPTGNVTDPVGTPEPATLALAGLGLPLIGAARLRRRKRAA